jgi:SpoVK/Ycf46/Vps4 family AAA+-type ATPase
MALDKKYKFKDLKVYASTEWLADGKKKYRTVFENAETSYLYAELSFYNKLFDEEDWDTKIKLKAFRIKEKNVREELCSIDLDHHVPKEDNIVQIREGWGNKEAGVFWTRGDYVWEAYIGADLVGTKNFYVENGGPVQPDDNPYFEIDTIKLYEGPNKGVTSSDRVYLTHFNAKDTRYVWAEFNINNLQSTSWYCELFFHFYNDAGQLKGRTTEVKKINPDDDLVAITTGWGSDSKGTWYEDKYTLQVLFMDQLVAVVTFEAGTEVIEGVNPILTGSAILPQQSHKVDDSNETLETVMEKLNGMIGLEPVKARAKDYVHYLKFLQLRKEQGFDETQKISLHSVFKGNPGTGKTTVAKMIGKIYHKMGLLSNGKVHEVGRADLVGQYIGQTAPKVKEAIDKARGGVLFIDEAYSLVRSKEDSKDYGQEVVETLIKEMSDGPGDIAIIVAGYPKEMDVFLNSNPGFKSRFNLYFDFPDYLPQELIQIVDVCAKQRNVEFAPEAVVFLGKKITEAYRSRDSSFGNARLVNSLVDEAKMNMGLRVMKANEANNADKSSEKLPEETLRTITLEDVEKVFKNRERRLPDLPIDDAMLQEAMTELNGLIGLREVKNQIHDLIKLTQFYKDTGKDVLGSFSMHTIFKGNPGTGKTSVARIIAMIYKALGILERGHIVEVDRQALVAGFIGQTAIKTKEKIDEAIGGVLFIDEAYALAGDSGNDFGKEALEVILKQMEDRRGEFIVIAAGYPDNMDRFIEMNPGLKSRFDKTLIFADYSADELYEIAVAMLLAERLVTDPDADTHLRKYLQILYDRRDKYFGNARSVRKIISQAIKNQHLRMSMIDKKLRTAEMLATITVEDLKDFNLDEEAGSGKRIGFMRNS